MFTLNIRRVYFICDKVIIRNLRGRRLDINNPGLDNRIKAYKREGIAFEDNDVEEFIEQSASDFSKAGVAYDEHLMETRIGKQKLSQYIIKEKYFKETMPNLLTWSEKEQIRHLCTTQPDEWSPQRIAESFPVTVSVVKKLLKYPWKPATEQRIARHDASALRNWKELKEGTLNISEELRKKFLSFSDRTIPPLHKNSIKSDIKDEKIGEYEKIIQRCAKENSNYNNTDSTSMSTSLIMNVGNTEETDETLMKMDKRRVTLTELATKIKRRLDNNRDVDIPDRMIVDALDSTTDAAELTSTDLTNEIELLKDNTENKQMTKFEEKSGDVKLPEYAERIRIPKKAYKRGATYKVNDCYYDHDGRFLYRVLGMSN